MQTLGPIRKHLIFDTHYLYFLIVKGNVMSLKLSNSPLRILCEIDLYAVDPYLTRARYVVGWVVS